MTKVALDSPTSTGRFVGPQGNGIGTPGAVAVLGMRWPMGQCRVGRGFCPSHEE